MKAEGIDRYSEDAKDLPGVCWPGLPPRRAGPSIPTVRATGVQRDVTHGGGAWLSFECQVPGRGPPV